MINFLRALIIGGSKRAILEANEVHRKTFKTLLFSIFILMITAIWFNFQGWLYWNIALLYIVLFAIVAISTRPNVLLAVIAMEVSSEKLKFIEKDKNLLKEWYSFIIALLLYVSLSLFILGTFSFKENIPGLFVVFAGVIILFLMDAKWNWSTRIAKPFLYTYVIAIIIANVALAIPTYVYIKTIGMNPVAWLTISESQKTMVKIDSTIRKIADKKKNMQLQVIQKKLDTCLHNAKTVADLDKCEEVRASIETSLEEMKEPSMLKESMGFISSILKKFQKDPPPTGTEDILEPRPLGFDLSPKPAKTYTFIGQGNTGGIDGKGGIRTIKNFVQVKPGQKVVVSNNTEIYDHGVYKRMHSFINRAREHDYFWMRAKKGERITVIVI